MARHDPASMREAIRCFEDAIARDPDFAAAHACLGEAYYLLWHFLTMPTEPATQRAEDACRRALELDPFLSQARVTLATLTHRHLWKWDEAEALFRTAIEMDPNSAPAYQEYGFLLLGRGRFEEAAECMEKALHIDSASTVVNTRLGVIHYFAGRYREALRRYAMTLDLKPDDYFARLLGVMACVQLGAFEEGLEHLDVLDRVYGTPTTATAFRIYIEARTGKQEQARKRLDRLRQSSEERFVQPYDLAVAERGFGNLDAVLDHLEEAADQRFGFLCFALVDPLWEILRESPRFRALRARVAPLTDSEGTAAPPSPAEGA